MDTLKRLKNESFLLADKPYDSDAIRGYDDGCGSMTIIPPRSNPKRKIDYI